MQDNASYFKFSGETDEEWTFLLDGDTFTTSVSGSYQARITLQGGTTALSNTIDYVTDEITSIDDNLLQQAEQIVVDANPSTWVFNLAFLTEFVGDFDLSVVGADGQQKVRSLIQGYVVGEQVPLDLTNLTDGLYLVNVANTSARASIKILKRSN